MLELNSDYSSSEEYSYDLVDNSEYESDDDGYEKEEEEDEDETMNWKDEKKKGVYRYNKKRRKKFALFLLLFPIIIYILRIPLGNIGLYWLDNPEKLAKLAFLAQFLSKMARFSGGVVGSPRPFVPPRLQHFVFERVNGYYNVDKAAFAKSLHMLDSEFSESKKTRAVDDLFSNIFNKQLLVTNGMSEEKSLDDEEKRHNNISIIIDLKPDMAFSCIDTLRQQISFLIGVHRDSDFRKNIMKVDENSDFEIVVRLESSGGQVQPYALAAAQLKRLRDETGVVLTICVDQVAASGGYMCACMATPGHLLASPFALVGSIGVVGQAVNIHKILEKQGVKTITLKSDEAKAPISLIGEITDEGLDHVKSQFAEVYDAFKNLIQRSRDEIDIDQVSTGQVWLGEDAKALNLVDHIITSEEYICDLLSDGRRVFLLTPYKKQNIFAPYSLMSHATYTVRQFMQVIFSEVQKSFNIFKL